MKARWGKATGRRLGSAKERADGARPGALGEHGASEIVTCEAMDPRAAPEIVFGPGIPIAL